MRYVRVPDDASDARYAASGGHFAGLIDQLIETKVVKVWTALMLRRKLCIAR